MDIWDNGRPRTYYRFDRLGGSTETGSWHPGGHYNQAEEPLCPGCHRTLMPYDKERCPRCGAELPEELAS